MTLPPLESLPGYRRRFIITPQPGVVRGELEDDYHHMGVVIRHEHGVANAIEAITIRAPWNTCPAAVAQLNKTFLGVPLAAFAIRGEAKLNCTHLHDVAVLAAAHAHDAGPLIYDVLVSDPVEDRARCELRRNGETILNWTVAALQIVAPAELAGMNLFDMRAVLATLDPPAQEATRVLRWSSIIARGRIIPFEQQSNASTMPASCFSFQPGIKEHAYRIGGEKDFSDGSRQPLDERAIS